MSEWGLAYMGAQKERESKNPLQNNRFKIIRRASGLLELSCPHGVGHPLKAPNSEPKSSWGVHGCDQCCMRPGWKREARRIKRDVVSNVSAGWMV